MKKSILQKIMVAALVMVIGLQSGSVNAQAATKNWSLRYIKYAPTSEYKTRWEQWGLMPTQSKTIMKVNQVGGNAQVFVGTSNGISSIFKGPGSTKVIKIDKSKPIYAVVSYNKMGTATNYPSGKLTY